MAKDKAPRRLAGNAKSSSGIHLDGNWWRRMAFDGNWLL